MNILVIDIGGSNVKLFSSRERVRRKFPSGAGLTASQMAEEVRARVSDWQYDRVSIGYPGTVRHERITAEPYNLGSGWTDFDFAGALGCPVKLLNDAAMQALGGYRGGSMLFLGLGTGLGSAMIVDGTIVPMELGHLPYKEHTYEDYVGDLARKKKGGKIWHKTVLEVIEHLRAAFQPDEVLLGGGNVKKLEALPPGCRRGSNADAFTGGFRLWDKAVPAAELPSKTSS